MIRHRTDLLVITNSIKIAAEFRNTANKVLVPGGMMLPELSLVGPVTTEALRRLHAAKAILDCGGLTLEHGLSYFDINETEVRRTMIGISEASIVVADHTKFGHTETVSLGPANMVDVVITDREPAAEFREVFGRGGVQLIVA